MSTLREFDLEDAIWRSWNSHQQEELGKRGLFLGPGRMYRQFDLGAYGRIDLLHVGLDIEPLPPEYSRGRGYRRNLNVTGIELKAGMIGYSELGQAARYLQAMQDMCTYDEKFVGSILRIARTGEVSVRMLLVGSSITQSGDFVFAASACENIDVLTYDLSIESGVEFSEGGHEWRMRDEVMSEQRRELRREIIAQHREWYAGEVLLRYAKSLESEQ